MNAVQEFDAYARLEDDSTLVIQRWLPGPAERIWNYLTDSDLRAKWLAAGDMDMAGGSEFEFVWRNDDLSDEDDKRPEGFGADHRMTSRVISAEPPRRLVIGWGKGDVTFELEPRGERVLLTLTHRGLSADMSRTMIGAGWHTHLDILVDIADGARHPSFWSEWKKRRTEYETRFAG
ncbi:SRPBCC family protein [Tepidamorphus sp. 3E244]|uniref:SRPBCC family protein n=1 Tax=Tepidamorphus sp. 3E244 TaxID=3385498 RepID=UPI0038FD1086